MVQAAHAATNLVFQVRRELDPVRWGEHGPHLIVYGVRDEQELLAIEARIGPSAVSFREPDLGGRLTAIAQLGPSLPDFQAHDLL